MFVPVSSQAYTFLITVLGGMIVGFIYDLFRVWRKIIKTRNIMVYAQDIIFWILVSLVVFGTLFISNAGEIRGYLLIGIILGTTIYMLTLSQYVVDFLIRAVRILVGILIYLYKIFSVPVKAIIKILYYPIFHMYNLSKRIYKFFNRINAKIFYRLKLNIKNIKISIKKF